MRLATAVQTYPGSTYVNLDCAHCDADRRADYIAHCDTDGSADDNTYRYTHRHSY
jgi:hypothetical protein